MLSFHTVKAITMRRASSPLNASPLYCTIEATVFKLARPHRTLDAVDETYVTSPGALPRGTTWQQDGSSAFFSPRYLAVH